MLKNIHDLGLDCIVCIGGNGTQKTAAKLAQAGVNVVSVPKTIDNDVWGTDVSFGFDSASFMSHRSEERRVSSDGARSVENIFWQRASGMSCAATSAEKHRRFKTSGNLTRGQEKITMTCFIKMNARTGATK